MIDGGRHTIVVALVISGLVLPVALAGSVAATEPMITAVTAGGGFSCALTSGGGVKCWGNNQVGQLGNGQSGSPSSVPVDVEGLGTALTAIAAGESYVCGVTVGGSVTCWPDSFAPVPGLAGGVTAIAAGLQHACALTSGGAVQCWGRGEEGQLGNGIATSRAPLAVSGLAGGVIAITAGFTHTCALTTPGGVKCWGANDGGQLGIGTYDYEHHPTPTDVTGLAGGVIAIAAGWSNTCAVTRAGGVKCWGGKVYGLVPVDVPGLTSGVTAVTGGQFHTCALTSSGGVKCWGDNSTAQLGNGNRTSSSVPFNVSGLSSGVIAIAAGDFHTCALTSSGRVKCWGYNNQGQLGIWKYPDSVVPVDVDFSARALPQTDTAGPGPDPRPADIPWLAVLAGISAGIVILISRRSGADDPTTRRGPSGH
jgi:hypothetical protein